MPRAINPANRALYILVWCGWAAAAAQIEGPQGLTVSLTPQGSYNITISDPAWQFGGEIGHPVSNLRTSAGVDGIGPYNEITFDYSAGTLRHAFLRAYADQRSVLFSVNYQGEAANLEPFPALVRYPSGMHALTYSGIFAAPSFSASGNQGPWVFFNSAANAYILSPASNFMTAFTAWGAKNAIASGISPKILTLPDGFTQTTLLVIGTGINQAFETWGHALTALTGKIRPANDADISLRKLGYWTDAGASYYYHHDPQLSYADTLLAVRNDFTEQGIELGYLQLDSWFYPKGEHIDWKDGKHGIAEYRAAEQLFPEGLANFQQRLALPLITHARWIDSSSPYRHQYRMSGNVSVDPLYWARLAQYLDNADVATYEQDWLGAKAQSDFNLTDPDSFLDNMAAATAARGLTMQYCMATPAHFLESTRYSNLTTIRTSDDRFNRSRWTRFLYSGRLASALGIWPFSDAFMSSETGNLLMAVLSAGPVGVGDALGTIDKDNLLKAVRQDGILVKPDAPLTPVDASFLATHADLNAPVIASTYSDFAGLRIHYVFAYDQGSGTAPSVTYSDLGITSLAYAYDFFADAGKLVNPSDAFPAPPSNSQTYTILATVGPSGMAVLGDLGQFVSLGKQRIPQFSDDGQVRLSISFARQERSRTIHGYAPARPVVEVLTGRLGAAAWDRQTDRFTIEVFPATDGTASLRLSPAR